MEKNWRLILDGKHDGYYNMAVDEALFCSGVPTLRIYGWSQPFISLGYNQQASQVLCPGQGLPVVRRITGGAAIVHHQELTYSLVCSGAALDLGPGVKASYRRLCAFLLDFYSRLGLRPEFAQDLFKGALGSYGNFCFSSCEPFDLVAGSRKLGGNAQRRRKDIIFQQGSIPQAFDPQLIVASIANSAGFPAQAASLDELLGQNTDFSRLVPILARSFQETFGLNLKASELTKAEKDLAQQLLATKYTKESWNFRKDQPLTTISQFSLVIK